MPDPSSAAELLAPGGSVARLLAHYEARLEQQQMAELVDRALGENKLAVIEAGPGTGKSFGYLFALLLHALRTGTAAVVSSSTHVLQDQLIQKDIPFMQRVLEEQGIEFRAAEVKGMGAYLCRLALAETSGALIVDFPVKVLFQKIPDGTCAVTACVQLPAKPWFQTSSLIGTPVLSSMELAILIGRPMGVM